MFAIRLFLLLLIPAALHAADLTFPKLADAQRVRGELISADFVHRTGQFRTEQGERVDFSMPLYAIMRYRGAESDLRDVPLGAKMDFFMLPGGKLLTTDDGQKPDPEQQKKFRDFTERRGVAGWITHTEGKRVTVQLFSADPVFFESAYGDLIAKGKSTRTCVANDELRTWNPPVDGENGSIQELNRRPADGFGFSGYEITVSVSNMLEGFRKGRVVRVFLQGWKAQDPFYGESLMGYGFGRMQNTELLENVAKEYPDQFPFRTDFGNAHLPWYQLKEDVKPPPFSEHLICGELVSQTQFLSERTGEKVTFTLTSKPAIKHLGKDVGLADLPLNQRYRFHCFQDAQGRFTRVTLISDDFSHQVANFTTARITAIQGQRLHLAWMLPLVKDYNGDMQRPEPFGHSVLVVTEDTKIWKADQPLKYGDLKIGDELRFNVSTELPGRPSQAVAMTMMGNSIEAPETKK